MKNRASENTVYPQHFCSSRKQMFFSPNAVGKNFVAGISNIIHILPPFKSLERSLRPENKAQINGMRVTEKCVC